VGEHHHRRRVSVVCFWISSMTLAVAALGCAAEPVHEPSLSTAAVVGDVRITDAPSALPIELHWDDARDGRAPVRSLNLAIENTTTESLDVDVRVSSRAGTRSAITAPARVKVGPRSRVAHGIAVDQLGLQVVGASSTALVTAAYTTADGITRTSALPAVWIEHQAGFAAATVRSAVAEARSNAQSTIAALRARKPQAARGLDTASGRIVDLGAPADDSLTSAQLVSQPAWLPTPGQLREMYPSDAAKDTPEIADADRADSKSNAMAPASNKGGNFKICFFLPFWYADSLLGEDILTAQTATSEGSEPARYMLAALTNSANQIFWAGNLDTAGCTPLINHADGTYTGWLTTSIYRATSDVLIDVTMDDTKTFIWATQNYGISGSGGQRSLIFLGAWSLPDAAVAAANTLFRSTSAYPNGTRTDIFTDQDCPSIPGSGCASQTQIWLGNNLNGFPNAGFKVVTQHELGHRVQGALVGVPLNDYTIDATQASCRCDHVTSSNKLHCLQGRSMVSAAQVEGWGQFFAAKNLNNGADSNCTLGYYKEFRNDNNTVTAPPMAKSCFSQVRWMAGRCATDNRGTEWDWMNHFWRLSNKDGYSFTDFKNVYRSACGGGSCNNVNVTWYSTDAAATAVFGSNSVKANAWSVQGVNFGVNF
jgi:hypothetical protein